MLETFEETPGLSPALSIVVPVYNGAATVGELVKALRALEIEGGLEIVLVVDGSPDNSLDVCKELVALLPLLLGLRADDTVVFPEIAYPTYDVGARIAGCRIVAADSTVALGPEQVSLVFTYHRCSR